MDRVGRASTAQTNLIKLEKLSKYASERWFWLWRWKGGGGLLSPHKTNPVTVRWKYFLLNVIKNHGSGSLVRFQAV